MCQSSAPESVHGPERAGPLSPTALLASSVKATTMRKGGHQNLTQSRCPTGAFVLSVTIRYPKDLKGSATHCAAFRPPRLD